MSVTVKVISSRHELLDFAYFPIRIYSREKHRPWTTPDEMLNMLSFWNTYWLKAKYKCFLAVDNGQIVGRLTAIYDPRTPKTGFFGALEIVEDMEEAAENLFKAAEEWLIVQGAEEITGPATFNTNQQVGLLIDGFDEPPQPFIPYNPPYYRRLLEEYGFTKLNDLLSYKYSADQDLPAVINKVAGRAAQKTGLLMRSLKVTSLSREVETIRLILNESMAENWGYIPLSRQEVEGMLYFCLSRGDPSLVLTIFIDSEPAAFSMSLPGSAKYCARLALLGVVPRFRLKGLEALLFQKTQSILSSKGYKIIEASQISENNLPMLKLIPKLENSRLIKRHRYYRKDL
ncbi:MAG TPA: hypothetical protein DCK76_03580 [Desulfotomaculum sp.]|nr:MAG: hypothetical protein XD84_1997 [Desulfotomaculum sp. 46_80]KUK84821.1 MAG: hypothetical protein XE00_0512 [Desulfofundulus kuznetsovii]HAG10470.1 hypothetical protein [Desulfotomaculum sp.]HBY03424.1 hypothetical protein [Desulfotomaculum sp.]